MIIHRWWRWAVLLGLALAVLFVPLPANARPASTRTIKIQASRFAYNPAVIHVNPGDTVTIELSAMDVVHGLAIDGYGLQTTADPGQPARLTFVARRQGSFRFHCTVTCGNLHPFMTGKLEVGQDLFLWRSIGLVSLAIFSAVWLSRK